MTDLDLNLYKDNVILSDLKLKSLWSAGLIFSGLSWPAVILIVVKERSLVLSWVFVLVLFFAIVGFYFLRNAFFKTLTYIKFGIPELRMKTCPASLGGELSAVAVIPRIIQTSNGFHTCLRCTRTIMVKSRVNNRHTSTTTTVWEKNKTVPAEIDHQNSRVTIIPVNFRIPYNAKTADGQGDKGVIKWELSIEADTSGVDFEANFHRLPVAITKQSDPDYTLKKDSTDTIGITKQSDLVRRLSERRILLERKFASLQIESLMIRNISVKAIIVPTVFILLSSPN